MTEYAEIDTLEGEIEIDPATIVEPTVDNLRWIVQNRSYRIFAWGNDHLLIDLQTANAMMLVFDALSPAGQETFSKRLATSRGWCTSIANFAWEHVSLK